MDLAELSIRRPVFITCVTLLLFAVGLLSMSRIGVELFPDVTFPVVVVTTPYPGAGPQEIETLISKPLEDEIASLSGLKRLRSINQDGLSVVVAEFRLKTDIRFAEQQIRDRVGSARRKLPQDIDEPVIRRVDPSDQPILKIALRSSLPDGQLFDLANETIRPRLEQVDDVGLVQILGGRKREVKVELDRVKLKSYEVSASQVVQRIRASGENIPAGKIEEGRSESIFRTMAEFSSLEDIKNVVVNFFGNEVPVRVKDVGNVQDSLVDKKTETYVNGEKSLLISIFKQSGTNTIGVVDGVLKRMAVINDDLKKLNVNADLVPVYDGSLWIRWNIADVEEAILLGIILAVLVVFLFLGSLRSTIITGLAIPNSLIGAFVLIALAGFTVNVMSLLALSLAVGLLVDDAIVVRENIFRHLEKGKTPIQAAIEGTGEVRLAVIATTLTVIAVFGPVGFVDGIVGQFLKQFGLTVCFAMAISLFDALTIAPMLSAYFAGDPHAKAKTAVGRAIDSVLQRFNRFQNRMEDNYTGFLHFSLRQPWKVIGVSFVVFLAMMSVGPFVTKTFLPAQEGGEFQVSLDLKPGASLEAMSEISRKVDEVIRKNPEVKVTALTVGNADGEANVASIYVQLVPSGERAASTSEMKDRVRLQLQPYLEANPIVGDFDAVGGGERPFSMNLVGSDQERVKAFASKLFERLKTHSALKDPDMNFREGKPEFRVQLNGSRAELLGVSQKAVGDELRIQLEGVEAAKFRQKGVEYDIRVRLQENQRNLIADYKKIHVPNLNGNLIPLTALSEGQLTQGPAKIYRQDRSRYIQINADISPGRGMGEAINDIEKWLRTDLPLPVGMQTQYVGQVEDFQELGVNMGIAFGLGILFIFLVLASLYESFITPFTIMLALPLAICGSIVALFITNESVNIFSILGIVMLVGVASKNSILLVDHAAQKVREGWDVVAAMIDAGKMRLRPILMTSMALIAGSMPIAIGLNEASKQRTSMGIAIIGGLVSSTLLSLIVIPSAYIIIERMKARFREKKPELKRAG